MSESSHNSHPAAIKLHGLLEELKAADHKGAHLLEALLHNVDWDHVENYPDLEDLPTFNDLRAAAEHFGCRFEARADMLDAISDQVEEGNVQSMLYQLVADLKKDLADYQKKVIAGVYREMRNARKA